MKKLLSLILGLLSMTLPMSAEIGKQFQYSYPEKKDLPYNLGYQYSIYDLKESDVEGWRVMYLEEPVTLTYNITSEEDKTVEVVFDPTYLVLKDIVIPDKVVDPDTKTEYTVTAIGKMAFDDCPEIRSVIMGDSITRIEDYAFNMCENKVLHKIGYVKFSKNLTYIGNYAFKNCHNLTTGHFTEGNQWPLIVSDFVRNVDYPIYGYGGRQSGLENYLLLPASVEYIGKHAFEGCHFINIEQEKNKREYGLSKVKIPNPSCEIDDYAFAGCQFLELITIGEELNYNGLKNPTPSTDKKGRIGDYAFADCNLMRLDIPSSIESIGQHAFSNCFHRIRMHTPRVNEGWIYLDNLQWFYPRALFDNYDSWWANWNNASNFTEDRKKKTEEYLSKWHTNTVTIHSDETKIGLNAFANNPLLEKVVINGKAGEFADAVFKNCGKLNEVTLPDDLAKVSNSMFMNCTELTEISIPDNVTEIGDSAFYLCKKLETIELPSELEKVNPYTFYNCELLNLSELPGNVNSIGNYAFYGCKNISSFTIPDRVRSIGEYAFADCRSHASRLNPDYGKGSDEPYIYIFGLTQVKISDGVQTIGAHAFDGCHHLGAIEMGANVTEIGDYAFQNCMSCPKVDCEAANNESTNELKLPDSLTKMGTGAFQGCTHLQGITLGENMTELPDFAFAGCSSLLTIGNIGNVTSAKENTFLGCYSLKDFGNLFSDKGNLDDGIIYNEEGTEVISALPNIAEAKINEGVTSIRDGAFADCGGLQSVSFPETLKEIGSRAFANCGALESLKFPNSLEEIGSRAFENCTSLESADLIDVKMGEFVYAGCTGIEAVTIAEDFTQDLQDNWFAGCINMSAIAVVGDNKRYSSYENQLLLNKEEDTLLRAPSGIEELWLPETVTKIGDYACSNCINLDYVEIPPTVTHIGAHAFDSCYWEEFDDDGELFNSWGLNNVYLANPAVTIGEYAFNNCKDLTEIYWDEEAEDGVMGSIGAFAFNNCENLTIATDNLISAAISTLEPYAFANFPGIEKIELPETLKSIGDHAFENCQNLTSVVFPESLKSIGNSAFKSSGLTYLDFPDNIEEIGDSAFMDCSKVMALKLPSSLKKINPYTFYKCFSGTQFDKKPEKNFNLRVEIPNSVESIGDYAFYGCAVNSNKYSGLTNQTYSEYHHFYNYGILSVSIGENVKTIGAHAFDGCYHLAEVEMGNAVTSIGDYAFNDCFQQRFNGVRKVEVLLLGTYDKPLNTYPVVWNLDEFTPQPIALPEVLQSLGVGAFSGCAELPSINFPARLTAIPDQAFNGCKLFTKIDLPEGITSIGDKAFGGCIGVKEIHVPASLEKGSRTFVDCDSALTVYYYADQPKTFDEAFFSPKVYSSKQSVANTPNALLDDVKGLTPWALFYKIIAKDDTLVHLERVLEPKNGLRFRVLANKPVPYCEVAGPAETPVDSLTYTYDVPEYVVNIDEESDYYGKEYKVIRIGNDAFENDLTLVGITIPESVFDIGQEAFNGCMNLLEINLPKSITNMGERAFANCYGLTYFEVPEKVTRLNPEVLKDCRGLYSIKMHKDIEELGMGALMDCRHLRTLEGAENWNLKLIGDYALKNCIELEDINIPEGVEKIGKEALYYCQKLKIVSLPKTLLELGENTFDDCEELTKIKVYTEIPPKMIGERHLTDQSCKIYVQAKHVDTYKEFWKVHEHRIEPGIIMTLPKVTEMPEYIPGETYKFNASMPLDGQEIKIWSSANTTVASHGDSPDGKMVLNGVGRTAIHVETDQKFYHDCTLDVYPQLADANWDGRFNISDAVNIANYAVMNQSVLTNWWKTERRDFGSESVWNVFYYRGADVNRDGDISFADASAAVKVVLAKPVATASSVNRVKALVGSRELDALVIFPTSGNFIGVGLDSSREYVALEANIRVPEGMKLIGVTAGKGADGHALSTRRIDDRTMRVILFDLNNSAFAAGCDPLLQLEVSGDATADDIDIFDIIASDISSASYGLTTRTGATTSGLGSVTGEAPSYVLTPDGVTFSDVAGKSIAVYAVDGRVIRSFTAESDTVTISLNAGIYIISVNGNSLKIAIK